jgi:hypothetical protein
MGLGQVVVGTVGSNPAQGMDVCPRLCCVVLCRQRPCDGLITHPRSPTICLNSSRNLLYVRWPRSFKDCGAIGGGSALSQLDPLVEIKKVLRFEVFMMVKMYLKNFCMHSLAPLS